MAQPPEEPAHGAAIGVRLKRQDEIAADLGADGPGDARGLAEQDHLGQRDDADDDWLGGIPGKVPVL